MRRTNISLSRQIPPILAGRFSFRSFHHDRVSVVGGERPPFTLDQVVTLTMPLLRFLNPNGIVTRRIVL